MRARCSLRGLSERPQILEAAQADPSDVGVEEKTGDVASFVPFSKFREQRGRGREWEPGRGRGRKFDAKDASRRGKEKKGDPLKKFR
jgi:hypothetical protein